MTSPLNGQGDPAPGGDSPRDPHEGDQRWFTTTVGERISGFLCAQREELREISPDTTELLDAIATLSAGGKRMRASLCYWGWRGAGGDPRAEQIISAGAALELFQSAALIHDDIIDNSDTRRGSPSIHQLFGSFHHDRNWALDPERFGQAAAILAGDMCLSFSEEMFSSVGDAAGQVGAARKVFNRMRTEVMAGQYLDVLEEVAGPEKDPAGAVGRARTIIRYKSAKYSTEHPLMLGGALAGGSETLLSQYSGFALPLGEAFQLRDDVLGVYGDPGTTGKPAGDDLREGKRTVLTGYAFNLAPAGEAALLAKSLGNPKLGDSDVERLRHIIEDCGALRATEELIQDLSTRAFAALTGLEVDRPTCQALTALAEAAVRRVS